MGQMSKKWFEYSGSASRNMAFRTFASSLLQAEAGHGHDEEHGIASACFSSGTSY
jgi:hypothetical protein